MKPLSAKTSVVLLLILLTACSGRKPDQFRDLQVPPEEIASLLTAELLSRPEFMLYSTPDVYALHYAEVCAAYGALKIAGQLQDDQTLNALVSHYEKATPEYIPNSANHVDANVYGILPLEIFMLTNDTSYLEEGLLFADGQWKDPLQDGLSGQTRYWIDDIYMINSLQVRAFEATGDSIYLERAALETDAYIKGLQQDNGLFFHGPDAPFFWGRGNGWVAAGFAELLALLPDTNPYYPSILEAYRKMMKTLLENQDEDGMWHQLIDQPGSFRESSSTAMFGYAMTTGAKKGLLPSDPYVSSCVRAWNALCVYLDETGKIREVCVGTGQSRDIEFYFNRPRITGDLHGQAPMLWFASALIGD